MQFHSHELEWNARILSKEINLQSEEKILWNNLELFDLISFTANYTLIVLLK